MKGNWAKKIKDYWDVDFFPEVSESEKDKLKLELTDIAANNGGNIYVTGNASFMTRATQCQAQINTGRSDPS